MRTERRLHPAVAVGLKLVANGTVLGFRYFLTSQRGLLFEGNKADPAHVIVALNAIAENLDVIKDIVASFAIQTVGQLFLLQANICSR